MHPYLPSVPRSRWVLATVIGALLAWTLGMLPHAFDERLRPG